MTIGAGAKIQQLFDPVRQAVFLQALRCSPIVGHAARAAGITVETAYRLRRRSKAFAGAWDEAREAAVDEIEDVAIKRAVDGSDQLMVQILRAHRPERYRPQIDVDVQGRVDIVVDLVPAGASASASVEADEATDVIEGELLED